MVEHCLLGLGAARCQNVDNAAGGVDHNVHAHGRTYIAPVGAIVFAEFELALGVILDQDTQLQSSIEMAIQGINLTGPWGALARRKSIGQRQLQSANIFVVTKQNV